MPAVAGFDSRRSILSSAVFHSASTRMMTSGSRSTMVSQPRLVHVSSTSATMFSIPSCSIIIAGAPLPAPTYGVSVPEEYQSTDGAPSTGSTPSRISRWEATRASAASFASTMRPASSMSSNTSSKVSESGLYPSPWHADGAT